MMQTATITTCNTIWRYCAVNLTALGLSILGLMVLGVAPAIASAYWAMSRPELSVDQLCRGMVREWRAEFLRANFLAAPFGLFILAWGVSPIATAVPLPLLLLAAMFALQWTLAALFAVSLARASLTDTVINTGLLLGARPFRMFLVTLSLIGLAILATWQPLMVLYGLFSLHGACAVGLLGSMREPSRRPLVAPSSTLEVAQ